MVREVGLSIRCSCSKWMGAVQTLLLCLLSYFHFFDRKWVLILNWKIPINHMLCSVSVGPIPPLPPHPNLHSILSSLPSFLCPGSYSPLLLLSLINYFFPSLPPTLCSFPPSFLSFPLPPSFVLLNIFLLPSSPSTSRLFSSHLLLGWIIIHGSYLKL